MPWQATVYLHKVHAYIDGMTYHISETCYCNTNKARESETDRQRNVGTERNMWFNVYDYRESDRKLL